ncbi:MAG: MFS transporter [Rubrivivax sp.]|nr:MFS transporter [Rubrivivax sp.]MCA3256791.1 MFS transporter [Rubrivivax sp.]
MRPDPDARSEPPAAPPWGTPQPASPAATQVPASPAATQVPASPAGTQTPVVPVAPAPGPPGVPPAEVEPRYGWVVVAACFTALALIFGLSYSFAAFFEPFAAEFGAGRAEVSLVFGLSGLLYFVLGAFAGMLADRHGPAPVAAAGMLCIAAALAAGSLAQSLFQLTLAWGLGLGVGIALVYTPSIGCVQPWFTRRRGLAAGIASAGIGAGTLVLPLLAAAAVAALQWRGAMQLLALAVLVLGLAAALLLRRAPAARRVAGGQVAGVPLGVALRSRNFLWLYAMCLLGAPAMFVPFAHLSAAARDIGVSEAQAVGLVGLIGIGSLSGRFVIGGLADRWGRGPTLAAVMASLGLSMALWLAADGYAALALFALWMGLSYGGAVSLMPALCMDLFGARAVSSIIGTLYTGAALGNLGGPWVAGRVFDATGSYAPVVAACGVLALVAAVAALAAIRTPPPLAPPVAGPRAS